MFANSKIRDENGKLRKVYHGTYNEFNVFDPEYIGTASGDDGFFGQGFYFAYTKGEASYYGKKRIISAYLNIKNPFNFDKAFNYYKGKTTNYMGPDEAVRLMNFAR